MAVIFLRKKEIHYLDSLHWNGLRFVIDNLHNYRVLSANIVQLSRHLNNLLRWLKDEAEDKKQLPVKPDDWRFINLRPSIPYQTNNVDCGVFMVLFADLLSNNAALDFNQSDIPSFREMITSNILQGQMRL